MITIIFGFCEFFVVDYTVSSQTILPLTKLSVEEVMRKCYVLVSLHFRLKTINGCQLYWYLQFVRTIDGLIQSIAILQGGSHLEWINLSIGLLR